MSFNKILSSDLPGIDGAIKECINTGQWFLFRYQGAEPGGNAVFFLKIGKDWFELDERGAVKNQVMAWDGFQDCGELVYFSDIPQPKSLSNAVFF